MAELGLLETADAVSRQRLPGDPAADGEQAAVAPGND
jgi:hypothetical protein